MLIILGTTKVNGKIDKDTEKANRSGMMDQFTKGTGRTIWQTRKAD